MALVLLFMLLVAVAVIGIGVLIGAGIVRIGTRDGRVAQVYQSTAIAAGAVVSGGLMAVLLLVRPWG